MILERLRELLIEPGLLATDQSGRPAPEDLRVATVALLLEVAYGDQPYLREERRAILRGIKREFDVDERDAALLMESAELARPPRKTLQELTDLVRQRYDDAQRQRVLALVWKVVDADGCFAEYEQTFTEYVTGALALDEASSREARDMARRGDA